MDRRGFLKTCVTGAALVAANESLAFAADAATATGKGPLATAKAVAGPKESAAAATTLPAVTDASERKGDMLYRKLGRTGETVSLLGIGGFHIGNPKDPAESVKIIRSAIDRGVTFMDNSWDYHDGDSEVRMGNALKDGYRQKVFLMTKVDGRTKDSAGRQIDESLKRLGTDHLDLLQFHENIRMEDADRIFAEGGGMEAALAARKAGKVRFLGFTGHKDPIVHLRMLEVAAEHDFTFDTVQMPLNVLDAHFRSFARVVLPEAMNLQMGILGMKPLASGDVMATRTVTAAEALHYAMNLPTSVVINGIDSMERLEQALDAVKTFKPMDRSEVAAILAKTAKVAAGGKYEKFKTSDQFDSTAHNPQWLG